jgi:SnoaL-like domain
MIKYRVWTSLAAVVAILLAGPVSAQSPVRLTTADYIAIQQLTAAYPYKLGSCTNSGYDYADQYTKDAVFGVASAWDDPGKVWFRGREQLAEADGGGKGGCKPRSKSETVTHHLVLSEVITVTAQGVMGRSTLLSITSSASGPSIIEWQGGYRDIYVKTPKGWRFKSRFHVWPGHPWPDTWREQEAIFAAQAKAAHHK